MARPSRCRRICFGPAYESFVPEGIPGSGLVGLTLDEYEAIRLIDLERQTHAQCAKQMDISRTTVTEIYESARKKIADSLVNGKPLLISGGNYRFCDGSAVRYCQKNCRRADGLAPDSKASGKGAAEMRIAVTFENGTIFQHFGRTEQFKLYDVSDGTITKEQIVDTNGNGHGALAGFLKEAGTDALICGGIGGGAKLALADAGIKLYGGVSGEADSAVKDFLAGQLSYNPDTACGHHGHEHPDSLCGEKTHGCHGNGGGGK